MRANNKESYGHLSKKCPECLTYIPLDAAVCPACKKRVGKVTETGLAKRPVDWISYLMLAIAVAAFSSYILWMVVSD